MCGAHRPLTSQKGSKGFPGRANHPFYPGLVDLQDNRPVPARQLAAARADAAAMHVGWVLVWRWPKGLASYLSSAGFRFGYRADNVAVYRAVQQPWSRSDR